MQIITEDQEDQEEDEDGEEDEEQDEDKEALAQALLDSKDEISKLKQQVHTLSCFDIILTYLQ